jgi:UDP-2,4-diacetamido-2,4,6-trideoxy-beta-L-altropyranose hydrolase
VSKVYFRADGGSVVGWGHLYRCLAVAEMISEYFSVCFLLKEYHDFFLKELKARRFSYSIVNDEEGYLLMLERNDLLVLDGYTFSTEFQTRVRSFCKLLVIDDLHNGIYNADIILNHCPGVTQGAYQTIDANVQFALGCDYAILRKEFMIAARDLPSSKSSKNLLICFGGADPLNYTLKCLHQVISCSEIDHIDVIIGGSYLFENSLRDLQSAKVAVYKNLTASEMVDRMKANSYAVVPASTILFECLALKLTCLSIAYVKNQQLIFDGFNNLNLIYPIFEVERVGKLLNEILSKKQAWVNPNCPIDGYSGERILQKINSVLV